VALHLTRKQSLWLGLGCLIAFFLASSITIYRRNSARVPTQSGLAHSGALSKEAIEGTSTPLATSSQAPTSQTPTTGLGFVLNEFHRSLVKDGKTLWEIKGERGKYDPLKSKAQITKPDLNVVRENGDTIHLTADRADLELTGTQLSSAELFDNVVAVYKGDTTVTTSRAIYRESEGTVEIPVPVKLDSPMFQLTGNKLFAKLDSQEIFITNGVTSTIKPKNK
jgi:LPS export ABC transporter protein LptC